MTSRPELILFFLFLKVAPFFIEVIAINKFIIIYVLVDIFIATHTEVWKLKRDFYLNLF